jgi:hypothetical protein
MSSAWVALTYAKDPVPSVLFALDERDYRGNTDLRNYVDGYRASSRRVAANTTGADSPRRLAQTRENSVDAMKGECLGRFVGSKGVIMPPYRVLTSKWPLKDSFRLSSEVEPPDASSFFESGRSGDSGDVLWDTEDVPVCYGVKAKMNSALADLDACEIELDDDTGTCAPDWDPGRVESLICTAFRACVREGNKHLKDVEKRLDRLAKLGSVPADLPHSNSDALKLWVLPAGWSNWDEVKNYYRDSVSDRVEEDVAMHPLRSYAANLCFLVIGGIGFLFAGIGEIGGCLGRID